MAKGLSPDDIAAQLYLRVTLIHDIENENLERLPPPPFITGYLRNYARLVGVPCEQVVYACEANSSGGGSMPTLANVSSDEEMGGRRTPVKALTAFIVLVLMVLVSVWWLGQEKPAELTPEMLSAQNAVGTPPRGAADSNTRITPPVTPKPPVVAPAPVVPKPPVGENPAGLNSGVPGEASENPDAPVEEGSGAEPALPTTEGPAEEPPVEVDPPTSGEGAASAPAAAPKPSSGETTVVVPKSLRAGEAQAELRLEMAEDCWTEVRDDAGRALYFNVAKAGSRLTLKGTAPFKLLLGNAAGSKVYLNGSAFDYSGRGVVRLTVGKASDNKVPQP